MTDSLKLETLRAGNSEALLASRGYRDLVALTESAQAADSQPPFNDQTLVDARAGRCVFSLVYSGETLAGAAVVNGDTLELVVDPALRGRGYGLAVTRHMLDEEKLISRHQPHVSYLSRLLEPFQSDIPVAIPTLAWSHGDHPAARALAERFGFHAARRLLQLRMPLSGTYLTTEPSGVMIDSFVPGADDDAWVALNARVFAGHPEQGRLTVDDLHARMAETWFDADDFLVARDSGGAMIGYNWLKIEPAPEPGEIYVIGVDREHAGMGLGRALMQRGLARLTARGCTSAALYVEEDNSPAVPLYRSLGFTDYTVDVQYAR
jgi:mycothiol synthase